MTQSKSSIIQQQVSTIANAQTSSFLNSPQVQPIAQLKQMQQQQFLSPLNSSTDNLVYQQQILPKLSISPGRLQTQVVNSPNRQVIDTSTPQSTSAL